jgi:hypothetical protein
VERDRHAGHAAPDDDDVRGAGHARVVRSRYRTQLSP